jgi:predicted amidohydrolase YtcJ
MARLARAWLGPLALLLSMCWLSATAATERVMAFIGGTLIDGTESAPILNAVVLVRGDRILAVGPASDFPVPADAIRIDAAGRWIIPGLIDAHVHFFQSGGLYTRVRTSSTCAPSVPMRLKWRRSRGACPTP